MKILRCIVKIFLALLWSVFLMLISPFSFIGLSRWQRVRRGAFWAQLWARGSAKIAGVTTVIHGEIPQNDGVLLVSNHLGYLDILAHAVNFRLRFTPNDGIKHWPLVGWLVALSCPIWIDRKNRRKAAGYAVEFQHTMANGVSLLVYPEGTTTDGKHGLLPFKSTVFSAVEPGRAIVPMILTYRQIPADGASAAWFDDTPFGKHVLGVLGLKKVVIDIYMLPAMYAAENEERKVLANRVRETMLEEYNKHA